MTDRDNIVGIAPALTGKMKNKGWLEV